ncbi:MAG: MCP four helix bundle domain-containing protein [Oligoflexia bacterium]|nr:MCP four helix bundle domain-containing protein [Oligoflexia bacterium]
MKKLSLPKKILFSFILTIAAMVCVGLTGFYSTKENYKNGNEIATVSLPTVKILTQLESSLWSISAAERALTIRGFRGEVRKTQYEVIEREFKKIAGNRKELEGFYFNSEEKKFLDDFTASYQEWIIQHEDLIKYSREVDTAVSANDQEKEKNYLELMQMRVLDSNLKLNLAVDALDKLSEYNIQETKDISVKLQKTYAVVSTFLISIILITLVLSILFLVYIMRILNSFASVVTNSTVVVAAESKQVAEGNGDLSSRTQDQASLLEETASTLEEITSQVRQTADHCQKAAQISRMAVTTADNGINVSGEAKQAMGEISTSSKKISEIIGLVEVIAFQTNILAINAAIEAAKAGNQGKGFAVVAIEVRDLAQRASSATKEIKSLITDSVEKVEKGEKLVILNNEKLLEISSNINQVAGLMDEISAATREQFSAVEQINKAVVELDSVTQQNASLVEEIASSSEIVKNKTAAMGALMDEIFSGQKLDHAQNNENAHNANRLVAGARKSATATSGGGSGSGKKTLGGVFTTSCDSSSDQLITGPKMNSGETGKDGNGGEVINLPIGKNSTSRTRGDNSQTQKMSTDEKEVVESILRKNSGNFSDGQDF